MAKIMIDCANPNDFREVVEQAEKAVRNCIVTYAKRDIELQEKGLSKSTRQSARIIAEETGESPDAVRMKINRGKPQVEQPVPPGHNNQPPEETCVDYDDIKPKVTKMPSKNQEWDEAIGKLKLMIDSVSDYIDEMSRMSQWKRGKKQVMHICNELKYVVSERK